MSQYVVGDIQGCYRELMLLLEHVGFSYDTDHLWCVGDIVARGPDSLDALRFFADAPDHAVNTVLGNHDLNLISVLLGLRQPHRKDNTDAIIASKRRLDWIDWLRHRPLLHLDAPHNLLISHAGLYPWWSIVEAESSALEVAHILRSDDFAAFIKSMFGDTPKKWHSSLSGFDRYRFIVNALTRMRYCTADGELNFSEKMHPRDNNDNELRPWFDYYDQPYRVAFGHWAALMGDSTHKQTIALDTGCVWGNHMTLWDVDNDIFYHQSAVR